MSPVEGRIRGQGTQQSPTQPPNISHTYLFPFESGSSFGPRGPHISLEVTKMISLSPRLHEPHYPAITPQLSWPPRALLEARLVALISTL